ncbi:DUF6896 domain-containing protein [Roseiconus lacunae]|uniref:DUF6896 domain-containing protein n=1 Tax=Roseiconus lacunae TaxID=2605694 RepID=UPI001E3E9D4D|nr:hypothetical protein [Roseiconus lacunae]MCD0458956.1 hypothetical protein [Roseiconus lacunae]
MDDRLRPLIDDYKSTVARAVAALEATGIPRPASTTEWVGYDVPGRGQLKGGGEYFIHGFGCAVRLPDTSVDFDFGDDGQIDGFDWYRLSSFAGSLLSTKYGIPDETKLRSLIDDAHTSGDLVHSGYILSYTRDSLPSNFGDEDGGEQ